MARTRIVATTAWTAVASALAVVPACGTNGATVGFDAGPSAPVLGGIDDGGVVSDGGCVGLQCRQRACEGGTPTTLTGHVYDPAGNNPLYKVVVYVPNSDPSPIADGVDAASCSCDSLYSGFPIATGISQPDGSFSVPNAPDGKDVPLVVQIGKWRNYFTIPKVTACAANDLDELLPSKLTLPKTQNETRFSNIPNIAISTGNADTLECILTRIGISEQEYTGDPDLAQKHVHIFQGAGGNNTTGPAGPSSPAAGGLWDSDADMARYDVVLLSCEGVQTTSPNPQVLANYVNRGGRVFASHYHYAFFFDDQANAPTPPFPNVADWALANVAAQPGATDTYLETIGATIQTTLPSGGAFPEGQALAAWLAQVGALGTGGVPVGELEIPKGAGRHDAVVRPTNVSTVWAQSDPAAEPKSSQYFSFDMPFDAPLDDAGRPGYCGRVVFSDLHVGQASNDYAGGKNTTPSGCSYPQKLAPDEDAIEFILFDLSSCVTPVSSVPLPPPPLK